jgi:hypothetical protein
MFRLLSLGHHKAHSHKTTTGHIIMNIFDDDLMKAV